MENNTTNLEISDKIFSNLEFNRYGLMCAILAIVGCLGGIAVGMGGILHTWSLILIVIPMMATLSFMLAVAPMKLVLWTGIIASIIDVIFIAYYSLV